MNITDTTARVVTIVVGRPFAERAGEAAVRVWADIVLQTGAETQTHGSQAIEAALASRFAAAALDLAPIELERMAEMLADPGMGRLVVTTSDGHVLGTVPIEKPAADVIHAEEKQTAAEQVEPSDPERPAYS